MHEKLLLVKFLYYQLTVDRLEKTKRKKFLFDLTEFASMMKEKNIEERNWEYNGDTIRLKKFSFDENDILHMQFERLNDIDIPYIATPSMVEDKDVALGEDEFIASDINAIFDISNSVLMLQRNFKSLSPKAVFSYINHYWNKDKDENQKEIIEFEPIVNPRVFTQAKQSECYKKLTIKTANRFEEKATSFQRLQDSFDGVLGKIIKDIQPLNSLNVEVSFTTSRKKDDVMDDNQVNYLIKQIEDNKSEFSKAELSIVDEHNKTEILNLLNALLIDSYRFTIVPKSRLRSDVVQDAMKLIYLPINGGKDRKSEINMILR